MFIATRVEIDIVDARKRPDESAELRNPSGIARGRPSGGPAHLEGRRLSSLRRSAANKSCRVPETRLERYCS
jgi:hypothetical protein